MFGLCVWEESRGFKSWSSCRKPSRGDVVLLSTTARLPFSKPNKQNIANSLPSHCQFPALGVSCRSEAACALGEAGRSGLGEEVSCSLSSF